MKLLHKSTVSNSSPSILCKFTISSLNLHWNCFCQVHSELNSKCYLLPLLPATLKNFLISINGNFMLSFTQAKNTNHLWFLFILMQLSENPIDSTFHSLHCYHTGLNHHLCHMDQCNSLLTGATPSFSCSFLPFYIPYQFYFKWLTSGAPGMFSPLQKHKINSSPLSSTFLNLFFPTKDSLSTQNKN